jgi:hypothetical protein
MPNIDINLTDKTDQAVVTEHRKRLTKEEIRAKLVTVLERGITIDRLHVDLPPEVYGEWVANDAVEIYRMESLGFTVDTEFAKKRALHDNGTGERGIVGDAIFMTCPIEYKEVMEEIKRENYALANSPKAGRQKEERDFANITKAEGLPSEIKSRIDPTNLSNIRAALTAKN